MSREQLWGQRAIAADARRGQYVADFNRVNDRAINGNPATAPVSSGWIAQKPGPAAPAAGGNSSALANAGKTLTTTKANSKDAWRSELRQKVAMTSSQGIDTESLERAFMDQAYAEMRSRCKLLLKDPYRIGFEIVYKNEDASRMVGLAGFRAGRQLFFVPCFFLQAMIKGVDLLYRSLSRSFVPNTEEWVAYLIDQSAQNLGYPVDRAEGRYRKSLDIRTDMLAAPPHLGYGGIKRSSRAGETGDWMVTSLLEALDHLDAEGTKQASSRRCFGHCDWQVGDVRDMLDTMLTKQAEAQETGKALLQLISDIGEPAVQKLAHGVQTSHAFAEAIFGLYPKDEWLSPSLVKQATQEAPQAPSSALTFVTDPAAHDGECPHFLRHGFDVIDKRAAKDQSAVFVEANAEAHLTQISEPGKWNVMLADGSEAPVFVGLEAPGYYIGRLPTGDDDCCGAPMSTSSQPGRDEYRKPSLVLVRTTGKKDSITTRETCFGSQEKDLKELGKDLDTTVSQGKAYRALDLSTGHMSREFYVTGKTEKNGIVTAEITHRYTDEPQRLLTLNPEFEGCCFESGDLGSNVRFVEVGFVAGKRSDRAVEEYHRNLALGSEDSVRQWALQNAPVKSASVRYRSDRGTFAIKVAGVGEVQNLLKEAAMFNLTRGLSIPADNAFWLLEQAEDKTTADFTLWPCKSATMQLMRDPMQEFRTDQDSNFGLGMESPQVGHSRIQWTGGYPEAPRIGDAADPTLGGGARNDRVSDDILFTMAPEQLAQYAQQNKLPHVFEHGVIGELVNTFDANILVPRYLPEVEKGLDHLGRLLFLVYWKPGDFEFSYGVDDMAQLENGLLSNFKSLGQTVLDLKKKSGGSRPNAGATSS